MSHAEIEAAGALLVGWVILACYFALFVLLLAPAIRRVARVLWLTMVFRRDRVLAYDWGRSWRAARRHAA
jgi:hypothetical protein